MAFTYTCDGETVDGNKRIRWGTFTASAAEETGDIYTGLQRVDMIRLTPVGSAVAAEECAVNETLPAYDPITIVMTAGVDGLWWAEGC